MSSAVNLLLIFPISFALISAENNEGSEMKPVFRILAPQFVCPKDEESVVDKLDETVVMLQTTAGEDLHTQWQVRWVPLPAPTQRFTLMLWRCVRDLEKKLNAPQKEKFVYVIDNSELLRGVVFVFTVTVRNSAGVSADPRTFHIDNSQGDNKIDLVEGRADMVSIVMLGPQIAYPDVEFVLEAKITMCYPNEDYYFEWSVKNLVTEEDVDLGEKSGARLVVPPHTLMPGPYDAHGRLYKYSDGHLITQTGLVFSVDRRGLEVFMMADYLVVSRDTPFTINTLLINHDYHDEAATYKWSCKSDGAECEFHWETSQHEDDFILPDGIPKPGVYLIEAVATVRDEEASATIHVEVMDVSLLPLIQITPMPRTVNDDEMVHFYANVTNASPSCTITWYFATDDDMTKPVDKNCDDCQDGTAISESIIVQSLEENFLLELADFSNATFTVEVTGETVGRAGRGRAAARCRGAGAEAAIAYADVYIKLNNRPVISDEITISPPSGVALETIFRITCPLAVDTNPPLRYSFYCDIGGKRSLLLSYFIEHRVVETSLPYNDGGTFVWVEVCDALGACSVGQRARVALAPPAAAAGTAAAAAARGTMARCELSVFTKNAVSAIVSFENIGDLDSVSTFSTVLTDVLGGKDAEACAGAAPSPFAVMLDKLSQIGYNTSELIV